METIILKKTESYEEILLKIFSLIIFLWISVGISAQQTRLMTGILKDGQGDPLPGVSIQIKGTSTGVITDLNGFYAIEAPVGSTLVFSYVGFLAQEVMVNAESGVDLPADTAKEKSKEGIKNFHHTIPDGGEKTLSPYFFVKSEDPSVDKMPLKSTSAEVNIAGVIADVTVKQLYVNEGKNTLEAIYIFPGSTKAAVYGMKMRIGERLLIAKIKEKQQARQEYELAKEEGKTATLLEQQRPNVFQMNVANILPGDTIEVTMQYTELLSATDGIYEFVYPTVVGPRYSETPDTPGNSSEQWVENPFLEEGQSAPYTFGLSVTINSGIPIKKVICNSHKIITNFSDENTANIALSSEESLGGNRDFILQYGLRGGKVESGILLYEHGDENFFLLMMEPPKTPQAEDIPGREYIFIVDVSGSMNGFPLDVSKAAMNKLLGSLRPTDKFNILTFAGNNSLMWKESQNATGENIRYGIHHMQNQSGGGGTRLLDALNTALNIPQDEGFSRTFVVITDGYVDFEKETFITVRDNLNNANLFALGIGSSTNRYLIEGLAHAGMGEPFIATNPEEGEKVGQKLIDLIQNPVLTDIKIDFGNFEAYDYEPSSIPDVFAQRPILVYGKYRGDASGMIKITGVTGQTHYVNYFTLKNAKQQNNQALRYLWARNKIRYIDDFEHYYTSQISGWYETRPSITNDQKAEVTNLGLKYNLLTQYTSFIAVDSIARRKTEEIITVKQPLPLPQGVSNFAIGNNTQYQNLVQYATEMNMTADIQSLNEVVVIGYGVQKKTNVTGSVTHVEESNVADLTSQGVTNLIQGKVSGLNVVNNSGVPGSASTITIRGASSLAGNNQPLYVVDGVAYSSADNSGSNVLSNINIQDIESVEILKDASSTSIYGCRGANGVILISTKKAKVNTDKALVRISGGVNSTDKKPNTAISGILPWYSGITQNSTYQKYDASYSRGRQKFSFLTSGGYYQNNGVVAGTGIYRYSTSNNFSASVFKNNIKLGGIFQGSLSNLNNRFPEYSSMDNSGQLQINTSVYGSEGNNLNLLGKLSADIQLPVKGLQWINFYSNQSAKNTFTYSDLPISEAFNYTFTGQFNTGLNYNLLAMNHEVDANLLYENLTDKNDLGFVFNNSENTDSTFNYTNRTNALASRVNYIYNQKYLVTLGIRSEKSSTMVNNEWITLPSLALAWRIIQEPFMDAVFSEISNLKLRYSLGLSGRGQLPRYQLIDPTINPYYPGMFSTMDFTNSENLKWEKTRTENLGLDMGFLRNRISATVDLYRSQTDNMFFLSDNGTGTLEWRNAGSFTNRGIDIDFRGVIIDNNNFRFAPLLTFAANRTKITSLTTLENAGVFRNYGGIITGQVLKTGDPIGAYYGYKIESVDDENRTLVISDKNSNGQIDEGDQQVIANINPKFYGGFGFEATFRKFELNTVFSYSYGNDVINIDAANYYRNYTPVGNDAGNVGSSLNSLSVSDGSYLRLSEIVAAYNFQSGVLSIDKIKYVRLAASVRNLLTITRYKGQDPEFNNGLAIDINGIQNSRGVDMNYYPVSKGVYLTLEVGF